MINFNFLENLKKAKSSLICLTSMTFIFFIERISKIQIINHQLEKDKIFINDFINLDLVWNTGIGFGFFSTNSNIFYHSITFIILCVIIFIIYLIKKSSFLEKILFSIILGGTLGNVYDRVVYFAVPDFIDIHYQRFHWFTFNIADIFITIGIITIILKDLFTKNEKI